MGGTSFPDKLHWGRVFQCVAASITAPWYGVRMPKAFLIEKDQVG